MNCYRPIDQNEYFQNVIRQKDLKIAELEGKLKTAELKIQQLLKKNSKKTSNDDIQVTGKDISFHIKEPLDTAHIAQFDTNLNSFSKVVPRPSEFKLVIPGTLKATRARSMPKKKIQESEEKGKNFGFSQLDEMIFSNFHDKSGWDSTMSNLRNDPKLLSKALRSEGTRKPKEILMRTSKSRKQEPSTIGITPKYRPLSAQIERKFQEIDWSQTVLDSYASKGILEFNFLRDQTVFSPYEVEDFLRKPKPIEKWDQFYRKGIKTLDKLVQELMLPKGSFIIPPRTSDNLEILIQECNKLFQARALVMKILSQIHKREDTLLKIMRFEAVNDQLKKNYNLLLHISQDLQQTIGFLSQTGLHLGEFIYLGENYSNKILQDEENIKELFPSLKSLDEV